MAQLHKDQITISSPQRLNPWADVNKPPCGGSVSVFPKTIQLILAKSTQVDL